MDIELKMKYCTIGFHSSQPEHGPYAIVQFAWETKAEPLSKVFFYAMENRMLKRAKEVFTPLFALEEQNNSIYIDDAHMMVNDYNDANKHHIVKLINIVKECEKEFEQMLTNEGVKS